MNFRTLRWAILLSLGCLSGCRRPHLRFKGRCILNWSLWSRSMRLYLPSMRFSYIISHYRWVIVNCKYIRCFWTYWWVFFIFISRITWWFRVFWSCCGFISRETTCWYNWGTWLSAWFGFRSHTFWLPLTYSRSILRMYGTIIGSMTPIIRHIRCPRFSDRRSFTYSWFFTRFRFPRIMNWRTFSFKFTSFL